MRKQVLECTLCHMEADLASVNLFMVKGILDMIGIDNFVAYAEAYADKPDNWKDDWLEITREDGYVAHICPQCRGQIMTAVNYQLLKISNR